ncbi:MAG TPA: SRPBCC family protein [Burkholderiaceae bacterium]|nr:SRPBCC family protein [Burkholderiaceae bacterium]
MRNSDDTRDWYYDTPSRNLRGGAQGGTNWMRVGTVMGIAGLALVAYAMRDRLPVAGRTLPGMRPRPIDVRGTIEIAASPEQVYDAWCRYEDFPRFMSKVEEVRPLDDERSRWVVKGPAGTHVEFVSVLTDRERGRLLAWRSEPGGTVDHVGRVELEPSAIGTRATVRMSYEPPAGRLGHAVATLFGRNPQQELDEDLQRMKAHVESLGSTAGTMPAIGSTAVPGISPIQTSH